MADSKQTAYASYITQCITTKCTYTHYSRLSYSILYYMPYSADSLVFPKVTIKMVTTRYSLKSFESKLTMDDVVQNF